VSERSKLTSSHLRRQAFVYLRQSSQTQVERNVESTARQYALVERAIELGFAREQVVVIDERLGDLCDLQDRPGSRSRPASATPLPPRRTNNPDVITQLRSDFADLDRF
jgi:hypothetical protein